MGHASDRAGSAVAKCTVGAGGAAGAGCFGGAGHLCRTCHGQARAARTGLQGLEGLDKGLGRMAGQDVDAGGASLADGGDTVVHQALDEGILDAFDQDTDAQFAGAQVQHQVGHDLARAVVGELPAPLGGDDGDVAGSEEVPGLAVHAQGEDGRVLHQPDFVTGGGGVVQFGPVEAQCRAGEADGAVCSRCRAGCRRGTGGMRPRAPGAHEGEVGASAGAGGVARAACRYHGRPGSLAGGRPLAHAGEGFGIGHGAQQAQADGRGSSH